jgi:HlyD family secretion protein
MAQNGKSGLLRSFCWVLWAVGAIVAVLLASFGSRDDSVPVVAATVARSTIRSVISTNGKVEPVQNFEAHAPVGTNVERVLVKEGDPVKRGQLLVELDAASARSQAAQALAQVRAAEANMNALARGGTQEEVLTLQAQLVKARADYDAAQRNLDSLRRLQQSGAASPGEVRAGQNQLDTTAAEVNTESKKGTLFLAGNCAVQAEQSQVQSA